MMPRLRLPDSPYIGYRLLDDSITVTDELIGELRQSIECSNVFVLPPVPLSDGHKNSTMLAPSESPFDQFVTLATYTYPDATSVDFAIACFPTLDEWVCAAFIKMMGDYRLLCVGNCIMDIRKFGIRVCPDGYSPDSSDQTFEYFIAQGIVRTLDRLGYYLNHHNTTVETVERCSPTQNAKRVRKGKIPLPSYSVIRIGDPRQIGTGERGDGGDRASVTPHDRRGHFRHYKSGITVWIDSIKVKGGSTAPREYRIVE